jgi:chromosome segregation ATPase
MEIRKQPPLSQEEIEILNLENRRVSAESSLQSASEAKKRLEADMEVITSKIEEGNTTIQKNLTDIETTSNLLSKTQISYQGEKDNLDKLLQSKKGIETDLENFKVETDKNKEIYKAKVNDEIKSLTDFKSVLEKEVQGLVDSKTPIKEEIKRLQSDLVVFSTQHEVEFNTVRDLQTKRDNMLATKDSLEIETKKLEDIISDQNKKIESTISSISDMSKEISDKGIEIETLNKKIEKKTEEYKAIENQAFTILNKQQLLDNKEAFIKNQYARAGVPWEE